MKTDITNPEPQVSTLGGELSLLDPDPADINIDDIITALRHESRYGGQSTERVSVLQHSLNVFLLAFIDGASCEDMRKALWHDAPEAYLKDIPRPLKKLLGEPYAELERRFEVAVGDALDVDLTKPPTDLRKWDTEALAAECYLWRPKEAYGNWMGLPWIVKALDDAAWGGKRIADTSTNSNIVYLDVLLRSGRVPLVEGWVEATGFRPGYGARKVVAE